MSSLTGSWKRIWCEWKSLRLPWRKRFLVGYDLDGNTFWEFRQTLSAPSSPGHHSLRRIVHYPRSTHYADIKVSPQWHQWLRHVRPTPPTVMEQREDVGRQVQLKELARLADERWNAKPSYLDPPETKEGTLRSAAGETNKKDKNDPWERAKRTGAPGETWQPQTWDPNQSMTSR